MAKVAKNVSGSASTTLDANATNLVVEDASYASVSVNSARITANDQTFTVSGVVAGNLSVVAENTLTPNAGGISRIAHFKYSLTAGDNAIYVSKDQVVAVSSTTALSSANTATVTPIGFSVDNTSGDGSTYFYIAPGQTKSFVADYKATGDNAVTKTAAIQITSLNYGTTTSATGGALNSSDLQSILKLTFF
jgi:hypothetical protein